MKAICVFCGSSMGSRPAYQLAAQQLGETLARRGLTLVYGGGNVGLMGVVADAALTAGGQVASCGRLRSALQVDAHRSLSALLQPCGRR